MDYDWPGNIRELENVIEHGFVLCRSDIIQEEDLPKPLRNRNIETISHNMVINKNQFMSAGQDIIINALKKNNGNKTKTAKELNMNPATLWRKMKKLGI